MNPHVVGCALLQLFAEPAQRPASSRARTTLCSRSPHSPRAGRRVRSARTPGPRRQSAGPRSARSTGTFGPRRRSLRQPQASRRSREAEFKNTEKHHQHYLRDNPGNSLNTMQSAPKHRKRPRETARLRTGRKKRTSSPRHRNALPVSQICRAQHQVGRASDAGPAGGPRPVQRVEAPPDSRARAKHLGEQALPKSKHIDAQY